MHAFFFFLYWGESKNIVFLSFLYFGTKSLTIIDHQSTFFTVDRLPPHPRPLNSLLDVSTSIAEVTSKRSVESRYDNFMF